MSETKKRKGGPIPDLSYLAEAGAKKCRTCKAIKPVEHYVRDKGTIDGLLRDCKPCKRAKLQLWREKTPAYNAKHAQKFREKNPEKRAAHLAIARALRAGTVMKQSCVICGETKSESHHEDYTKPLDVIWFCRTHHAEHHAAKRRIL
jgi:hypothetical protein